MELVNMENNLEDFLKNDLWNYFNSDEDAEEEYNNENDDAVNDDLNNENYYGENAGDILEDEEGTDDEDNDEEEENYTSNNPKPIGRLGEKFAKKYLEELFELNDVKLSVEKPSKDNEKHDLEIYGNGENYLIEVKFSTTKKHPNFKEIHFNNKFDYLFLIWKPENKFYFAFISKEDLINGDYATLENTNRKDDDYVIQRKDILHENILNELSKIFNTNKFLIDLNDERKLELYEEAENETEIDFEKLYEGIDENTLYYKLGFLTNTERGKIAQHSLYNFLKQYDINAENHDEGDFDILYKNRIIEVKFSRIDRQGQFQFAGIKHENFEFLFLIGLYIIDKKDVFYFNLMTSKEAEKYINEEKRGKEAYSQNGGRIQPTITSSRIKFVNHLTIEDIDNFIESHSN